jgi:uncharacterized protein (DUF433 family)
MAADDTTSPIWVDPERMSGTPCFTGTRVPVRNLFDSLRYDNSLSSFLESFPTVDRHQAIAVLEMAAAAVIPVGPVAAPSGPGRRERTAAVVGR